MCWKFGLQAVIMVRFQHCFPLAQVEIVGLDVGGGAVPNDTPYKLSGVSFRWMIAEIILADVGIIFRPDELTKFGISISSFVVFPTPNLTSPNPSGGINDRDVLDALAPFKDSLADPQWWLLEFIPVIEKYQDKDGKWKNRIRYAFFYFVHKTQRLTEYWCFGRKRKPVQTASS
jgi:hypothetical protein